MKLAALVVAGLLSGRPAVAEEPADGKKKDPVAEFVEKQGEKLAAHKEALQKSRLFRSLGEGGFLASANVLGGSPPGVSFSMQVGGRGYDVLYNPAHGDPPKPESLTVVGADGLSRPVDAPAAGGESLKEALPEAVRSALEKTPETTKAAEGLRDAAGGLTPAGRHLLAGAEKTAAQLAGAGASAAAALPPPDRAAYRREYGRDGMLEVVRYETRGNTTVRVVHSKDTPYGRRFFEAEKGEERYGRRVAGHDVFVRYKGGAAEITHVMQQGKWTPLAKAGLKEGAFEGASVLQQVGPEGNVYSYRFDRDGKGVPTHQNLQSAWVPMKDGKPLGAAEGAELKVVRSGARAYLVQFSQNNEKAQVLAAGNIWKDSTLYELSDKRAQPAAFAIQRGEYRHSFDPDGKGGLDGKLTGQLVKGDNGFSAWIDLPLPRPLTPAELPLARQEAGLQGKLDSGEARMMAQHNYAMAGVAAYPRVAQMVASRYPTPPRIGVAEVRSQVRAGPPAALPGRPDLQARLVGGNVAPDSQSRRSVVTVAASEAEAARTAGMLDRYQERLTFEVGKVAAGAALSGQADLWSRMSGAAGQAAELKRQLTPQRVTAVVGIDEQLEQNLRPINQKIVRMNLDAAGTGVQRTGQAARGEAALRNPGIFGFRGAIAQRRITREADNSYNEAVGGMHAARAETMKLVATGVEAARKRTERIAMTQAAAKDIREYQVLEPVDRKQELEYRAALGGGAAFSFKRDDGSQYLLPVADENPRLPEPGTALQVTAAVDVALTRLAAKYPQGLPQAEIDRVWREQLSKTYGLSPEEGRAAYQKLTAPPMTPAAPAPAPAAAPDSILRDRGSSAVQKIYRSNGYYLGTGPAGETYFFQGTDYYGREIWKRVYRNTSDRP